MKYLLQLITSALAVIITAYFLPGVNLETPLAALILAAVLSFLNSIVKPVMVLLTIPITLFTMGLFLLLINVFIIYLADYLVDGFSINGFWWALVFSLVLSLTTSLLRSIAAISNKTE